MGHIMYQRERKKKFQLFFYAPHPHYGDAGSKLYMKRSTIQCYAKSINELTPTNFFYEEMSMERWSFPGTVPLRAAFIS